MPRLRDNVVPKSPSTNSEDFDFVDAETAEYNESVVLFPSRSEGRSPIKDAQPASDPHLNESTARRLRA